MTYYMPTRVFDEDNCVLNHADDLAALGKKAMLVTGRHSAAANGSLDDVKKALEMKGIEYCIFSEVEENPSVETIFKARDLGIQEGVDFCIGIGGGSPLDASKAIAFTILHPTATEEDLYGGTLDSVALPVAEVPTTCGTGSEVTGVAVLTRHTKRTKGSIPYKIFPSLALIDGKYLKSASRTLILSTAV
nr:iron-containing alcohol dehydrogenase [Lachnospiraceae bacterium]